MKTKHEKMNVGPRTVRGFSLGEVLLSIAVLTVGILPILGALVSALNTSLDSQETVIASGLAQEGAELVLNVRDNGVLATGDAFAGFYQLVPGTLWIDNVRCRISLSDSNGSSGVLDDPSSAHQIGCSAGPIPPNYFDLTPDVSGVYRHMNTPGKFKRRIYLDLSPGFFFNKLVPGATLESYDVVSAVYWGTYGDTPTNVNTIANLLANCRAAKECVYTKVKLTPWK